MILSWTAGIKLLKTHKEVRMEKAKKSLFNSFERSWLNTKIPNKKLKIEDIKIIVGKMSILNYFIFSSDSR